VKLVLFQQSDVGAQLPGLLTDRGVVDISGVVRSNYTPQLVMEGIIDDFERLRPTLEKFAQTATALPLSSARLRAPLPRPHKILCALADYWEHAQRAPRPLNMFMKNPDAVIGPGDAIQLPAYSEASRARIGRVCDHRDDHVVRGHHCLRHQSRGIGGATGWRDGRNRDPGHR
jgi:hypothetical protein